MILAIGLGETARVWREIALRRKRVNLASITSTVFSLQNVLMVMIKCDFLFVTRHQQPTQTDCGQHSGALQQDKTSMNSHEYTRGTRFDVTDCEF